MKITDYFFIQSLLTRHCLKHNIKGSLAAAFTSDKEKQ